MKVIWSPLAEQRAREAVDDIAQDRPQASVVWVEELIKKVSSLDRFVRRGRVVPEIGRPQYREIFHAPYRIVYRVDATKIIILTLRHWRRAWDPTEVGNAGV